MSKRFFNRRKGCCKNNTVKRRPISFSYVMLKRSRPWTSAGIFVSGTRFLVTFGFLSHWTSCMDSCNNHNNRKISFLWNLPSPDAVVAPEFNNLIFERPYTSYTMLSNNGLLDHSAVKLYRTNNENCKISSMSISTAFEASIPKDFVTQWKLNWQDPQTILLENKSLSLRWLHSLDGHATGLSLNT